MKLNTLLGHLLVCRNHSSENPEISSLETDSRKVTDGSLFICIKGYTVDGHDFAAQAVEDGAAAVVAERPLDIPVPVAVVPDTRRAAAVLADAFYGHPTKRLHLIGVTGTNGKTTTTHLIQDIFLDAGRKTGLIGTLGMNIAGEAVPLASTTPTTPESVDLQKTFSHMVSEHADSAVTEVSSHALDMGRVWGTDYNIAVFTNLSQDHLEYHPSMDDYFRAKSLLFSQLGNTYDRNGVYAAVINADDERANELKKVTAVQMITYGVQGDADVRAEQLVLSERGSRFKLITPFGQTTVAFPLIGMFNVYNALAATSAALLSGVSVEQVKASLEGARNIPGRFEVVGEEAPVTVIVDYAHTPDSLENVLTTVNEFAKGRVFTVVGCGGDRDRTKRPLMARTAVNVSDMAVFTSDNPRSEDPEAIIRDMENGVHEETFVSIPDRAEAIHYAITEASDGDVIVIAGKGHETYQIIGDKVIDFDDREVARQAIRRRERRQ